MGTSSAANRSGGAAQEKGRTLTQISADLRRCRYSPTKRVAFGPASGNEKGMRMGKLDADPPARHRAEQGPARAQETGRHRKLAAPLMGPQAETMDRLISRTEEELGAWDFRQRQSRLANLRAAIVARHGERKA